MNGSSTNLETIAKDICARRKCTYLGVIGAGSFKQSFRIQEATSAEFALKIIAAGRADRLAREIDAISRCAHPNIGRLHEVRIEATAHGDVVYFLEPYLAGGTLTARCAQHGPPTAAHVRELARQLSSAIAYLAGLELVHRDIKPDNILFGQDPAVPILVDFGIVRDLAAESLTKSHMVRGPGTPFFAPAEQLNNQKELIDWRADQFALGVTLSLCVFGFHPYSEAADTDSDVVDRVAQRSSQSARFVHAAKDAGLEPLVRMTARFPVLRYCFPEQLVEAWA